MKRNPERQTQFMRCTLCLDRPKDLARNKNNCDTHSSRGKLFASFTLSYTLLDPAQATCGYCFWWDTAATRSGSSSHTLWMQPRETEPASKAALKWLLTQPKPGENTRRRNLAERPRKLSRGPARAKAPRAAASNPDPDPDQEQPSARPRSSGHPRAAAAPRHCPRTPAAAGTAGRTPAPRRPRQSAESPPDPLAAHLARGSPPQGAAGPCLLLTAPRRRPSRRTSRPVAPRRGALRAAGGERADTRADLRRMGGGGPSAGNAGDAAARAPRRDPRQVPSGSGAEGQPLPLAPRLPPAQRERRRAARRLLPPGGRAAPPRRARARRRQPPRPARPPLPLPLPQAGRRYDARPRGSRRMRRRPA